MSRKNIIILATVFAICAFLSLSAVAQQAQQDQEKMMEAFMKHRAVTENHAYLKNFAGEWEITAKGWMQPGAQPTVSKGSGVGELILGGRFIKLEFKGIMFGQPFEGLQVLGYDNMKKKYISFWIDNSSTSFYLNEGSLDKSGKVLTDTGLWPDPMTGGQTKVRAVTRVVSNNEYTYELYMTGPDGKEFKAMEYRSLRKK